MRRFAVCSLLVAAIGASSCGGNASASDQSRQGESRSPRVTDYASLVASLQAAGASVKPGAIVDQPFFPVSGRLIEVHGEEVQVFQFAHAAEGRAQAARISPTGSTIGTTKVHWIASALLPTIALPAPDRRAAFLPERQTSGSLRGRQ